jgi:hypothetical protein
LVWVLLCVSGAVLGVCCVVGTLSSCESETLGSGLLVLGVSCCVGCRVVVAARAAGCPSCRALGLVLSQSVAMHLLSAARGWPLPLWWGRGCGTSCSCCWVGGSVHDLGPCGAGHGVRGLVLLVRGCRALRAVRTPAWEQEALREGVQ